MMVSGQWQVINGSLPTAIQVSLEVNSHPLPSLEITYSHSQQLDCNLVRQPEQKPPSNAAPRFLIHRNCEIREKILNYKIFVIICDAAIDN